MGASMMEHANIVTLEVIDWQMGGGTHYTGHLIGYQGETGDSYERHQVTHALTAKEALTLNKLDECRPYMAKHKPGEISDRFETYEQLCAAAAKVYKTFFPKAKALTVGSFAVCDAQKCLAGPKSFKIACNKIYEKARRIGGYERSPKTMECLFRRYRKLVKTLNETTPAPECGECGAELTEPADIKAGFHPCCAQEMNEVMTHNAENPDDPI